MIDMNNSKPHIVIKLPAQKYILPALGAFLEHLFYSHPFLKGKDKNIFHYIKLVLYEAVSNVIKHAYPKHTSGEVIIKVFIEEQKVIFHVIDFGKGFNLLDIPQPNSHTPKEGGMGVFLIKKIADSVSYFYSPELKGNVLHIEITI